jgi:signal transduction histidine kinase/CheY-like chemotaxis protein
MWDSLTWWRKLHNPDLAREVAALRQETVGYLVVLTGLAVVAWHVVRVPIDGGAAEVMAHSLRQWALFAVVMAGLGATAWLQQRRSRLAPGCFLVTSALSIAAGAWLFQAPEALALVPLLTLAAIVLVHPLAGLATVAGTLGLLLLLRVAGPLAFVAPDRLLQAAVVALLTFAVAWALGRILVTAIESSAASHAEAWRHAQEARANRAELVQALKQLDLAYYRLQRANAALELAWKAADAAERSKTEFVTNISHELRTPLNLIIGFSEMILTAPEAYQAPLPVAYRGDLHAIYRSAQHLLTLTNDVIDLARVGMDRLALAREPLDAGEIIADAAGIVRAYIETKGLALRLAVEPDLPTLHADRLRLRQVLLNLLTNAARFTERGAITISAARTGGWVRVAVADTGRGIPADQLPKVFEEFYHDGGAATPPAERLGGIGLGLPLSKRLIELHGGHIGVESAVGRGTYFWFELPIAAPETAGRAGQPTRHRPRDAGPTERILVLAGPEPQFLDFLRRHLAGYRVVGTPDLAAAAAAAADLRALAIVADAAAAAGAASAAPVPVVSLPMPWGAQVGAEGMVVAHLVKPVARMVLYDTLRRLPAPVADVLIVDDDRRFVRLLRRMLETDPARPGYAIRTAFDGWTALDQMAAKRPDLVLLDLSLPALDGAGVLAAMRAAPDLAGVPVIIISAQDRLMAEFPLRGALTVAKPDGFGPEELLRLIDGVVSLLEPPRPAPPAEAGPERAGPASVR